MTDIQGRSTGPDGRVGEVAASASQESGAVAQHAKSAAADVSTTAREQAREVAHETAGQARRVVDDVRQRASQEADDQAKRVVQGINRLADELTSMAEHSSEGSPAAGALRQVADTGRQAARYLDERGVLDATQDFARRKPGTFLVGAAVAGFLVGRVVKSATGSSGSTTAEPATRPAVGQVPQSGGDPYLPVRETAVPPVAPAPQTTQTPQVYPPMDDPLVPEYSSRPGGAPHVQP
ncbi:MAG: hypothetical protein ABIQ18_24790 [Umezawaea sp.]